MTPSDTGSITRSQPNNLSVIDGDGPDRDQSEGHAVLVMSTAEERIKRFVGRAAEEFHDVLWYAQHHGRTEDPFAVESASVDPDDEPA